MASALLRLARSVDRTRSLLGAVGDGDSKGGLTAEALQRWLTRQERRSLVAERAIALFFAAVATFVLDSLCIAVDRLSGGAIAWLPIGITVLGMFLMLGGAAYMLHECQLGGEQIRDEVSRVRSQSETASY